MADTGKTAEQYKMLLRGAGSLKVDPGSPELTNTLKKMKRIQDIWAANSALPIREVNKSTGREDVRVNIPSPPSSLSKAKASSAIRAGVEKAQTSSSQKSLAPSSLQEETLIGKYDTRPKYSGRKFNRTRPTG